QGPRPSGSPPCVRHSTRRAFSTVGQPICAARLRKAAFGSGPLGESGLGSGSRARAGSTGAGAGSGTVSGSGRGETEILSWIGSELLSDGRENPARILSDRRSQ